MTLVAGSSWRYTLGLCMGSGYFPMGSWFYRGFYSTADKGKWIGFSLAETLAQDRQKQLNGPTKAFCAWKKTHAERRAPDSGFAYSDLNAE